MGPVRTTAAQVGALLDDKEYLTPDGSGGYIITGFLQAAKEMTTAYCATSGYSSVRLMLIETWLAAHFITQSIQQQKTSERAGDVSKGIAVPSWRNSGAGFMATRYGSMAITLDTAGNLLRAAERQEKGHLPNRSPIYGGSESSRRCGGFVGEFGGFYGDGCGQ